MVGRRSSIHDWGAIVVGLVIGILLGCFNGQMITRLKIPPFVATLGMLSIARGMTMLWTKVSDYRLGDGFAVLGTKSWLGIPRQLDSRKSDRGVYHHHQRRRVSDEHLCYRRQ